MIGNVEKALVGMIPKEDNLYMITNLSGNRKVNVFDLALNFNSIPYNSDVAIIVTAWWDQLKYMECTLTNYRLSGKFVLCSYDNPESCAFIIRSGKLPSYEIFMLPHAWVFNHATYDAQKRNGWFWDIRYAQGIVNNFDFKYVFTVNADCIWEKPDGVDRIIEILGDGDLMASSSNLRAEGGGGGVIHTCSVIYKIEAFNAIINCMTERMKVPIIGGHNPEVMLREAIRYHGLKEVKAPEQPLHTEEQWKGRIDHYNCTRQSCTWKEVLGYRNLGAELLTAIKSKEHDKIPYEYIDLDNYEVKL